MFDTHCHLDFAAYDGDREAVWQSARAAGVTEVHVPGVSPEQWSCAAVLRQLDAGIGSGVGIHPWWLAKLTATQLDDALAGLTTSAREFAAEAIGECGLDGALAKRGGPAVDDQIVVLDAHLECARALALPVVLHVVQAHGRALEVLRRHGVLAAGGVLHSYSGSAELVPQYAALGLSFSFAAAVTRANARRPLAAAREVPSHLLLLESDGPDQPLDGEKRSQPSDLATIGRAVAAARGDDPKAVAGVSSANARRLFARP